eukprot:TRINITY_DN10384_c0_g2_i1.p1 TRINITY_DN10384_c0_g2~~TRINITY_DN10384_c0_g2_i1.p1  ORF type:complete len:358 (+),score=80.58 TRINITY_DN10384_c0_g2_i1:70-1143(+)
MPTILLHSSGEPRSIDAERPTLELRAGPAPVMRKSYAKPIVRQRPSSPGSVPRLLRRPARRPGRAAAAPLRFPEWVHRLRLEGVPGAADAGDGCYPPPTSTLRAAGQPRPPVSPAKVIRSRADLRAVAERLAGWKRRPCARLIRCGDPSRTAVVGMMKRGGGELAPRGIKGEFRGLTSSPTRGKGPRGRRRPPSANSTPRITFQSGGSTPTGAWPPRRPLLPHGWHARDRPQLHTPQPPQGSPAGVETPSPQASPRTRTPTPRPAKVRRPASAPPASGPWWARTLLNAHASVEGEKPTLCHCCGAIQPHPPKSRPAGRTLVKSSVRVGLSLRGSPRRSPPPRPARFLTGTQCDYADD